MMLILLRDDALRRATLTARATFTHAHDAARGITYGTLSLPYAIPRRFFCERGALEDATRDGALHVYAPRRCLL